MYFVFFEFVHAVPWRELVFRQHSSPRTEVFQFLRACGVLRQSGKRLAVSSGIVYLIFRQLEGLQVTPSGGRYGEQLYR